MGGAGCLLVERSLCRCSGGWSWISSLWSVMECSVVNFEMGLWVLCDFGQPVY